MKRYWFFCLFPLMLVGCLGSRTASTSLADVVKEKKYAYEKRLDRARQQRDLLLGTLHHELEEPAK